MEIQKFYDLGIRRTVVSRQKMQQSVWDEYFHLPSNNPNPNLKAGVGFIVSKQKAKCMTTPSMRMFLFQ